MFSQHTREEISTSTGYSVYRVDNVTIYDGEENQIAYGDFLSSADGWRLYLPIDEDRTPTTDNMRYMGSYSNIKELVEAALFFFDNITVEDSDGHGLFE